MIQILYIYLFVYPFLKNIKNIIFLILNITFVWKGSGFNMEIIRNRIVGNGIVCKIVLLHL